MILREERESTIPFQLQSSLVSIIQNISMLCTKTLNKTCINIAVEITRYLIVWLFFSLSRISGYSRHNDDRYKPKPDDCSSWRWSRHQSQWFCCNYDQSYHGKFSWPNQPVKLFVRPWAYSPHWGKLWTKFRSKISRWLSYFKAGMV